jgi:acyl-CoA reductase-like NAD-dependent aldehyde dehydrogenase
MANSRRLRVLKTYKLFIGGKFPRSESGRVFAARSAVGETLGNCAHASRKDFRDAVVAARKAFAPWAGTTAYLRGQILYRAAEMLETRSAELVEELGRFDKRTRPQREVDAAIDRLVYFAGWTDKFAQIASSVNPVASSHFNFTTPEPTGVVVVICPDRVPLLGLVSLIAPAIVSGNAVIALASETAPLPAVGFAEILATSDLPGGVVNILTGTRKELAPHFATHMDVNAIVDGSRDPALRQVLAEGSATNLKRVHFREINDWFGEEPEQPATILDTVEFKTAWHPIGF